MQKVGGIVCLPWASIAERDIQSIIFSVSVFLLLFEKKLWGGTEVMQSRSWPRASQLTRPLVSAPYNQLWVDMVDCWDTHL